LTPTISPASPSLPALAGINVVIAIVDAISGEAVARLGWARGIDVQYGDYWRLFTSGWVHGSILHIAFNAYGIYVLGTIMERLHGWKPLLAVYFAALFGGSALGMVFYDPEIPLLGASAAAYGLFGAVLGFFYVRTGSIRGIMQVPMGRQLLIWLAFGIFISLQPGISFLGHAGGFVPGVILGVFFEHRYMRSLDLYHKLGVGVLLVAIVGLSVFACAPFTRATWYATQALRAYENGNYQRGDELLRSAKERIARDDGTHKLLIHLRVWREGNQENPREYNNDVLRLPLTHPRPFEIDGATLDMPFTYLKDRSTPENPEPLETAPEQP
jgi:membrane associated rhomboid family serine protease